MTEQWKKNIKKETNIYFWDQTIEDETMFFNVITFQF